MKKILFYSPTGLTSKQYGIGGEVMKTLIEEGKDLYFVRCDGVLKNCYFNRVHNVPGCAMCQSRQDNIFKLAGLSNENIYALQQYTESEAANIPTFNSLNELLTFSYKGVNVGRGAASSIISYFRDYELTTAKFGIWIDIELKKAINVLLNFEVFFEKVKPDVLYLFNGRFAEVFPVMELAKLKGIPFYTVEAGSRKNYELFENGLPHSISLRHKKIISGWEEEKDGSQREEIAKNWFIKKRFGDEEFERSHVQNQQRALLPAQFDHNKRNILILNSSEDEVKAVQEWIPSLYENQNEAIRQIVRAFAEDDSIRFVLRVHPNLGEIKNKQMGEIRQMNYSNLLVINPNDPADTYSLIENCEKTLVFSSTTGIEATFWGKPAILYGNSFYRDLGATYTPQSFEELVGLVKARLDPIPKEKTYPYGYYMSTYGIQPKFFKFDGLESSYFMGKKLKKAYPSAIKYLFRYAKYLKLWKKLFSLYYNEPFSVLHWKKLK